jgi:hypothetical protein
MTIWMTIWGKKSDYLQKPYIGNSSKSSKIKSYLRINHELPRADSDGVALTMALTTDPQQTS